MRSPHRRRLAASLLAAGALACLPSGSRAAVPAATLSIGWRALTLPPARYAVRDLWQHRDRGIASTLAVRLDAHGAALYRLLPH